MVTHLMGGLTKGQTDLQGRPKVQGLLQMNMGFAPETLGLRQPTKCPVEGCCPR